MATPVIIFRDPVARCWSWYHYIKPEVSYYTFLNKSYKTIGMGEMNPIKQCNMKKFITPWLELNPEIYSFENMIGTMPFLNEGDTPPITEAHSDLTRRLLREDLCKE